MQSDWQRGVLCNVAMGVVFVRFMFVYRRPILNFNHCIMKERKLSYMMFMFDIWKSCPLKDLPLIEVLFNLVTRCRL